MRKYYNSHEEMFGHDTDSYFDDSESFWGEKSFLGILERIEKTDSNVELMRIAEEELLMGSKLMAVKSARKAAKCGYSEAQNFLGECYELGLGVQKDEEEAVKWFTKAAVQMHVKALHNLASYYYNGTVVEKDEVLAEALLLLSAEYKHSREYLKSWYNVDSKKDKTYCYHESLEMAQQTLQAFIEKHR